MSKTSLFCIIKQITSGIYYLGSYQQFDTIVLPATKEKPTFISKTAAKVTKWISDVFTTQDTPEHTKKHNKFEAPEANWMRQESLEIHLQTTKKIFLEGDYYVGYDISTASDGVVNLFDCSYHQYISFGQQQFRHDWTTDSVRQVGIHENMLVLQVYICAVVNTHLKKTYVHE